MFWLAAWHRWALVQLLNKTVQGELGVSQWEMDIRSILTLTQQLSCSDQSFLVIAGSETWDKLVSINIFANTGHLVSGSALINTASISLIKEREKQNKNTALDSYQILNVHLKSSFGGILFWLFTAVLICNNVF